jgi:hypothetical protein
MPYLENLNLIFLEIITICIPSSENDPLKVEIYISNYNKIIIEEGHEAKILTF